MLRIFASAEDAGHSCTEMHRSIAATAPCGRRRIRVGHIAPPRSDNVPRDTPPASQRPSLVRQDMLCGKSEWILGSSSRFWAARIKPWSQRTILWRPRTSTPQDRPRNLGRGTGERRTGDGESGTGDDGRSSSRLPMPPAARRCGDRATLVKIRGSSPSGRRRRQSRRRRERRPS